MSDNKVTVRTTSLGTLVFLVFLVLKLLGKIDWSWWWVTSPLWIPWVIILGAVLLIAVINALVSDSGSKGWR